MAGRMPFSPLIDRLREKTSGRLVLSDLEQSRPSGEDLNDLSRKEAQDFEARLHDDKLYYEYVIRT